MHPAAHDLHQSTSVVHSCAKGPLSPCRTCRTTALTTTLRRRPYKAFSAACWPDKPSRNKSRRQYNHHSSTRATQQPERWAEELIQQYVKPNNIVGLGTGLLINTIIECMAQMASAGRLQGVKCVPASDVSASEAAFQGVTVTSLTDHPQVDVVFEEVDEIVLQDATLPFVAGRLAEPIQPQLLRMRMLLAASKCNVVLVDGLEKTSSKLRGILPVVVDADVWEDAGEALDDTFIPDAEVWRRSTAGYDPSDPRAVGNPYHSAEGHNILDVKFYGPFKLYGEDAEYEAIAAEVEKQEGVITHGLFVGVAAAAALITADGIDMFEPAATIQ